MAGAERQGAVDLEACAQQRTNNSGRHTPSAPRPDTHQTPQRTLHPEVHEWPCRAQINHLPSMRRHIVCTATRM